MVLAGLTQLICVWLAAGGPGDPASFLACVPCKSLCMSGGQLVVGQSRIVQVGMIIGNSVLPHVSHLAVLSGHVHGKGGGARVKASFNV